MARLDAAVEAWRADGRPTDELSAASRERILLGALRTLQGREPTPPLVPLFSPTWRWAWAGVAPVLALTVLLGIVAVPPGGERAAAPTRIEARKLAGDVVFLIANGTTTHRVSKRSVPDRGADATTIVTTDGSFRDALDSGETIVFYQID